jgi:transcriptional regulator with XRE-family HTH domain
METIGIRLRHARELRFLNQEELAARSGIGVATISRIENNHFEKRPRLSTIRRLADELGVDPMWLLAGESTEEVKTAA